MKSYTDLPQSHKLAEILPLESADMNWHELPSIGLFVRAFPYKQNNGATEGLFPCWSLAALLGVLPREARLLKSATDDIYYHCDCPKANIDEWFDNPVDACYETIIKLHELNLL